jgi:hypothetical protein
MNVLLQQLVSPTALLYLYVIITQFAHGVYLAGGIEAPYAFTFINFFGLLWIVGWWLLTDSRKRGVSWVYDIGFFLSIAWPFIMPYYLLKTRRAKGLLLIFAFAGTYMAALVIGMAFYLLLTVSTG